MPKCHIFMMEIKAHGKNFQLANHTVTWGKAPIYFPGPSKDKGFSGLGLGMQCTRVHQTFDFWTILHAPHNHFNTLSAVTLTRVIFCLCCLEILNNSAKSSSSTLRTFLNEKGRCISGDADVQLHNAEALGRLRTMPHSIFKNNLIPKSTCCRGNSTWVWMCSPETALPVITRCQKCFW